MANLDVSDNMYNIFTVIIVFMESIHWFNFTGFFPIKVTNFFIMHDRIKLTFRLRIYANTTKCDLDLRGRDGINSICCTYIG